MAKTMTGQMCGFLVFLAAFSSCSKSPSPNCRFRAGDDGGIFTLSTGLDDSIKPHSFIAILRRCLIRMRSYWQVRRPSRSLRSLKAAIVCDVSWLALRLLTGSLMSLWRRRSSFVAPRLAGVTSEEQRSRSSPRVTCVGLKVPKVSASSCSSTLITHSMVACFV